MIIPKLELFKSIPVDELKEVTDFLQIEDLSEHASSLEQLKQIRGEGLYAFGGSTLLCFPKKVFCDRNYRLNPNLNDRVLDIVYPLVAFMWKQLTEFSNKEFYPCFAEINIMPPNSEISTHSDSVEGIGIYPRVHLVLFSNDNVDFVVDNTTYHLPTGTCFVFNNSLLHSVVNHSAFFSRAHLVVDFAPKI
jgi:hypothetical protein